MKLFQELSKTIRITTNMPKYIPSFPYNKAQLIFTSDRVILHSREDAIFLFGKAAIGLSSVGTVNVDSKEGVIVNAPQIQLGLNAKKSGEPVTKANSTVRLLKLLIKDIAKLSSALSDISESGLENSVVKIATTAEKLKLTCERVKGQLDSIKSNITYTR